MKQIAIIGPTASGKTSLAIEVAKKTNSVILSLDSLSVYKEIDIASAKPTLAERDGIVHFGIDEICVNEKFDVIVFFEIYKKAKTFAQENNKNLIICGGSGFYLKSLIEGISPNIIASDDDILWVNDMLLDLPKSYEFLQKIDPPYSSKIYANDKYRIEKALLIYKSSNLSPTQFFEKNPKVPLVQNLQIFEILWDKDELRVRINERTKKMFDDRLIDEVKFLISKYGKNQVPFGSIGIKEVIDFLDGKINFKECKELVEIHTAQLAKKQRTFNRGQFPNKISANLETLKKEIFKYF